MKVFNLYKITKINKKSKSTAFKYAQVGDVFSFVIYINGTYGHQPTLTITNTRTGDKCHHSVTSIQSTLKMFEFEEVLIGGNN